MNHLKRTPEERAALLAHLREHYVYEPEGRIRHKDRDRPLNGCLRCATYRNKKPYLSVTIEVGGVRHDLLYQQVVWLVCKGRWPTMQLDHLNGNQQDNRIENLRECSGSENRLNTLLPWKPNKVTGVPGVSKDERKKAGYNCKIKGKNLFFRHPYEAFWVAMVCGKKYKQE